MKGHKIGIIAGHAYSILDAFEIPKPRSKKDRKSQTVYKYLNGEEIKVNDGNTFINICPQDANIVIE